MPRAYKKEPWSDLLWRMHMEGSPQADRTSRHGEDSLGEGWKDFSADVFNRLYSEGDLKPDDLEGQPAWAKRVHEELDNVSLWHDLKNRVKNSSPKWAVAGEACQELLNHLLGVAEGFNKNLDTEEETREKLRLACRRTGKATEEAEEGLEIILGLMAGTSGEVGKDSVDMEAVRESLKVLWGNADLKDMFKLAGRMFRSARKRAAEMVSSSAGEVHGVAPGRDISRLVPGEMLNLTDDDLFLDLLVRLGEGAVQCYELKARDPKEKGPIICLLDCSGSMACDGRWKWSKAAVLALMMQAEKEGRDVSLIGFNGEIILQQRVTPGQLSAPELQAFLSLDPAGGTNFNKALAAGLGMLGEEPDADMVMITDGFASVDTEHLSLMQDAQRLHGLALFVVGIGYDSGEACAGSLGPLAEAVLHIEETADGVKVAPVLCTERKRAA